MIEQRGIFFRSYQAVSAYAYEFLIELLSRIYAAEVNRSRHYRGARTCIPAIQIGSFDFPPLGFFRR